MSSRAIASAAPVVWVIAGLAALLTPAATAQPSFTQPLPGSAAPHGASVAIDTAIYVERLRPRGAALIRALEPAGHLARGDRIVTLLRWSRAGAPSATAGFTLTSALPPGLAWQASADSNEELSVDRGRHWGRLGQIRIGDRVATPEDVNAVRWRIPRAQAALGSGRIAYSGLVR